MWCHTFIYTSTWLTTSVGFDEGAATGTFVPDTRAEISGELIVALRPDTIFQLLLPAPEPMNMAMMYHALPAPRSEAPMRMCFVCSAARSMRTQSDTVLVLSRFAAMEVPRMIQLFDGQVYQRSGISHSPVSGF